jgi:aspartate aminotransferase
MYCAKHGCVELDGQSLTLLSSPMSGFYSVSTEQANPGRTQVRLAFVESAEKIQLIPELFARLLKEYLTRER